VTRLGDFPIVWLALFAAIIGLLFWAVTRDLESFRIEIEDGTPRVVRGKAPPGFVDDVRTITKHVETGVIRAVKEGGEPRLVGSSSIDDATLQRLRNAFSVRRRRQ
jgi:hypothetical protein